MYADPAISQRGKRRLRLSILTGEGVEPLSASRGRRVMKESVQATIADQSIMRTLLLNDTAVQYDDTVDPFERGDSVRHKDNCFVREALDEVCENPPFGGNVQC
jgi:hypothetical protein